MITLYHGSPVPDIQVLEPTVTPYFGKPKQVCLTTLFPMALLYGIRHFEYTYGYDRERRLYYEEYFPRALEELYEGKTAYVYTCLYREDMAPTEIPCEYTTPQAVPTARVERISDIYAALLEQSRRGALRIVRYSDLSPKRKAWIVQTEKKIIQAQGLLQKETGFARYLREKYPESWRLAQVETQP